MRKEVIKNVVKISLDILIKDKFYIIWAIALCLGGINNNMELSAFIFCGFGLIIFQDSLEKLNLYKIVPLKREEIFVSQIVTELIIIAIGSFIHIGRCILFRKNNFMIDTISIIVSLILISIMIQIGKHIKRKYHNGIRGIMMLILFVGQIICIEGNLEMSRIFINIMLISSIVLFITIVLLFQKKIKAFLNE